MTSAARWTRLVREAIWSYYVRPGYVLRGCSSPCRSLWRQLRLFAGYF